ncbi:hypothetical protein BCR44DRAFT_84752 [Catenaria anguillulae PL171]|uniref:Uncharacterized protein n=1 Tax=Catenaria anguillulae PL171 TaxID=765915 RepID=A0A1Y2HA29_9FUNG|nr:hypothetical protein BCR44DRAFT_84752 [Catenaria anguillulae PL171]
MLDHPSDTSVKYVDVERKSLTGCEHVEVLARDLVGRWRVVCGTKFLDDALEVVGVNRAPWNRRLDEPAGQAQRSSNIGLGVHSTDKTAVQCLSLLLLGSAASVESASICWVCKSGDAAAAVVEMADAARAAGGKVVAVPLCTSSVPSPEKKTWCHALATRS